MSKDKKNLTREQVGGGAPPEVCPSPASGKVYCPECGGDGFFEFPNPHCDISGEIIEDFDIEKCKKCEGEGVVGK